MVIREAGFSLEYFHVVMNKLRLFSSMEYLKANASKLTGLRKKYSETLPPSMLAALSGHD